MSKYDFDKIIDRSGTISEKWDIKEGELPMWVADMDFETAPEIKEAVLKRVSHGIYGYSLIPEEWKDAYVGWWKKRHGFEIDRDWLIFSTGVVPAISCIIRKLTTPAEKVMVMTPVYNIFFNSICNNGRVPVQCPLKYVGENAVGHFEIDWELFEELAADPQVTMLLFCNPQNPIGVVWDRETLRRVGEICDKNEIIVISDEIHCDLVMDGESYIPFASVNEVNRRISVTCVAPSKTFNIAGLKSSAVFVPDRRLRLRVCRGLNTDEVAEPNIIAVQGAIAAYNYGADWLDELIKYIGGNKKLVKEYIRDRIPVLTDVSEAATYLCWIDARRMGIEKPAAYIREKTGLWLSEGASYGENAAGYLRFNVAAPRSVVEEGLHRLEQGCS